METVVKKKGRLRRLFPYIAAILLACAAYVFTHPLVFNESFLSHAHCITFADLSFAGYAMDHGGRFPYSTNGYGDALLLMNEELGGGWYSVTGPGYTAAVFEKALKTGGHVAEEACGRVYVQGLTTNNDGAIAILFDKIATPIGGGHSFVWKSEWQQFATNQIRLLTEAGIPKQEAERLYAPTLK
jgi:hypothetical protein